jgi:pimeloyl-ACP methyl ester carboxylesterase/predicted glycosyltransferase
MATDMRTGPPPLEVEALSTAPEATRARYPDSEGYVERDRVRVFWECYGDGDPTILLLPTWTFVHSRVWKAQIAYLARHFRVVTFDPRGNGRSDRPPDSALYAESEFAADALAVMDASRTEQAVIASLSRGAQRALLLAAEHPERVLAAAFIGPWFPASRLGGLRWRVMAHARLKMFLRPAPFARSWLKFNGAHWLADYHDFVDWWSRRMFNTPHSTKQIEDAIGWAHQTDAETLIASTIANMAAPATRRDQLALARRVRCPVLVISAPNDKITPHADGKALAKATGGELLSVPDGGHCPQARKPVPVNLALRQLLERAEGRSSRPIRDPTAHHSDGRPRALYISSPIGLGHAQRDVAIAKELRALVPDLQIDWLAQHPVTKVLEGEGERIHPASERLANESSHIESESAEHDLQCFQAWRRMDEILIANFMVFHDVAREGAHDLWIADEGWEIDYYLHEHPNEKRAHYAWLTDFVGWLPMPDGGSHEAFLTADYNGEMVGHIARHPEVRDRALFVGNPDDIVSDRLGPDLPLIRDWTERNFDFVGYVSGFDPAQFGDRSALRAELGYGDDEQVCIVTVGGSGVGGHLLQRVIAAFPGAKERVPNLRMIVVAGPRIDPASLPQAEGLEVRAYVHNLYRHLAACDLAVVQGGLTTAMELAANKRPFLFFPLRHHFEQNFHVRHRLDRYSAGRSMDFETATPEVIAEAIAAEIGREVDYRDVESDGARRAAARLAEMIH